MKKKRAPGQQGDVWFEPVEKPDLEGFTKREDRTVAFGEATGHHHTFTETPEVEVWENEKTGKMYVHNPLTVEAPLTHQTHNKTMFPPGWTEVGQVGEHDPETGERRAVWD